MAHADALRDNIATCTDKFGAGYYLIPCCSCGAEVRSWNYQPQLRYRCPLCRLIERQRKALEKQKEKSQ